MRRLLPLAAALALTVPATASATTAGQPTTREDLSHVAALLFDGYAGCGASLIASDKVLTAAHCVQDTKPEELSLLIGTKRLSEPKQGEKIPAKSFEIHGQYDPETLAYDVAVITLLNPVTKATPIKLVPVDRPALWAPGKEALVTGWGLGGYPPSLEHWGMADHLNEVTVHRVDDEVCNTTVLGGIDKTTMVCAGEPYGVKDACYGDSGGPLHVFGDNNELLLAGTVSWGVGCGVPTQYGVYARIGSDPLHAWITQQIDGATATASSADTSTASTSETRAPASPAPAQPAPSSPPPSGGQAQPAPQSNGSSTGTRSRGTNSRRKRSRPAVTLRRCLKKARKARSATARRRAAARCRASYRASKRKAARRKAAAKRSRR